jgi:hypothetical protein
MNTIYVSDLIKSSFGRISFQCCAMVREIEPRMQDINLATSKIALEYKFLTHCDARKMTEARQLAIQSMKNRAHYLQTVASLLLDNAETLDNLKVYE